MRNMNIEAIFGGILALVVIGIAVFALADTTFSGVSLPKAPVGPTPVATTGTVSTTSNAPVLNASTVQDLVCECYDEAFALAGKVTVVSPEYRTGFEQCRARGGVDGGNAWTAGWNARLSARPYEASCRSYKRR